MSLTVFLSASAPSRSPFAEDVPPDHIFEIGEAVASLATAVFAVDGRLVFGGHPTITPLVAQTAMDYYAIESDDLRPPLPSRRPIAVYQSDLFAPDFVPDLYTLRDTGRELADFELTNIIQDGQVLKGLSDAEKRALQKTPALQESLTEMRTHMIQKEKPDVMVIIGGMDGIYEETDLFLNECPGIVYPVVATGGAARFIARERKDPRIRPLEGNFWNDLLPTGDEKDRSGVWVRSEVPGADPLPMTPYAEIMRRLVRLMIENQ